MYWPSPGRDVVRVRHQVRRYGAEFGVLGQLGETGKNLADNGLQPEYIAYVVKESAYHQARGLLATTCFGLVGLDRVYVESFFYINVFTFGF